MEITDCRKIGNKFIHIGKIKKGIMSVGDVVNTAVDKVLRMDMARNHTATHLLQRALQEVLGSHVHQAGSLVTPDYLRFDFSHYQAMSDEEIKKVEKRVNEIIYDKLPVKVSETTLQKAQEMGAMALFSEKYGDTVRLVKVGDYSLELCGGTHVNNTSEIGIFKIMSEGAVGAGMRRIEACTGPKAYEYLSKYKDAFISLAGLLKVGESDVNDKINEMTAALKEKDHEIEKLKQQSMNLSAEEYTKGAVDLKGIKLLTLKKDGYNKKDLRSLNDTLKSKLGSGIIVLAGIEDKKINLVASVSRDVIDKGIKAGDIVKKVSAVLGGNGGGRPDMAQGGGKDKSRIDEAFGLCRSYIEDSLK
jgi:alanyl-tRNA synthetase